MSAFETHQLMRVRTIVLLILLAACSDSVLDQVERQPDRITAIAGNNQVGEAGSHLPTALAVRVSDSSDRPVAGVPVHWHIGPQSVGGRAEKQTTTDTYGVAQTARLLGPFAGEQYTRASVAGLPDVSFTSIALIQGAVSIELAPAQSGDQQADTVQATLAPFRVLLKDHLGQPVAGVNVGWSRYDPTTTLGHLISVLSVTDKAGIAQNVMTLGTLASIGYPITVGAYVHGLQGSPVKFTATSLAGKAVAIRPLHDQQIGAIGSPVRLEVSAFDVHNNTAAVPPLTWAILAGDGSIVADTSFAGAWLTLGNNDGTVRTTARLASTASTAEAVFTTTAVTKHVVIKASNTAPPSFSPAHVQIPAGRRVGWTWERLCTSDFYYYFPPVCEDHNVVFEDAPTEPTSSPITGATSHLRTFTKPGVYRYRCTFHSVDFDNGIVGSVTVTDE